jgi:hypothetical protein
LSGGFLGGSGSGGGGAGLTTGFSGLPGETTVESLELLLEVDERRLPLEVSTWTMKSCQFMPRYRVS